MLQYPPHLMKNDAHLTFSFLGEKLTWDQDLDALVCQKVHSFESGVPGSIVMVERQMSLL